MIRRFSPHVDKYFLCIRAANRVAVHRPFATVVIENNEKLVHNLAVVLDNNPRVASEIGQAIDSESAKRVRSIIEKQNSESPFPPTRHQLRMVALAASIPYFGFGVLDNALMIVLGEMIDMTLCVKFGLSTMVAAALGNTFSDAVGVYSGAAVEDLAVRYGFEAPRLTRAQEAMDTTRRFDRLGQLFGVTFGCLVGMFPLLFMDVDYAENLKKNKALNDVYRVVVEDVAKVLDCEAAMLLLIDHEKGEIYPRSTSDKNLDSYRAPVGTGTSGVVAKTGQFLRIDDLPNCSELYRSDRHDDYFGSGIRVRSVLCWPILGIDPVDNREKVVGVLQVINKKSPDGGFTEKDEDICAALSTHISTSLATAHGLEKGFETNVENCGKTMKVHGLRVSVADDRATLQQLLQQLGSTTHSREAGGSQKDSSKETFAFGGSVIDLLRQAEAPANHALQQLIQPSCQDGN